MEEHIQKKMAEQEIKEERKKEPKKLSKKKQKLKHWRNERKRRGNASLQQNKNQEQWPNSKKGSRENRIHDKKEAQKKRKNDVVQKGGFKDYLSAEQKT